MKDLERFGEVSCDVDLTMYNTYGVESSCDYLIMPTSKDNLKGLMEYINKKHYKYIVLGSCSNVVLPSEHFHGIVIMLDKLDNVSLKSDYVEAECGIKMGELVNFLIRNERGGFEELGTIPGTLGGSIYGNTSVNNNTIMNSVISVLVLRDDEFVEVPRKYIRSSYRYSSFQEGNDIIVSAKLSICEKDSNEMRETLKNIRLKRVSTQPIEFKNAGSVFKNPEGDFAGRLIESCGLKGYNVGDAYVSEKHANFIINKGSATSEDIKELINIIKDKVKRECNVELELEQKIIEWE